MDRELASSLRACLEQLERGESLSACLARYPEQAADLEPMLLAAGALTELRPVRVPAAVRRQHWQMLGAALEGQARAARPTFRTRLTWPWAWDGARRLAPAGLGALLVCVVLTAGAVAASRPGEPAYGWRVAVERIPAWLQPSAEGRAEAELGIAQRRLQDVTMYLQAAQRADPVALAALQADDEAVAREAGSLPQAERLRLAERVAGQAGVLRVLAEEAGEPQGAGALRLAAGRIEATASHIRGGQAQPQTSDRIDAGQGTGNSPGADAAQGAADGPGEDAGRGPDPGPGADAGYGPSDGTPPVVRGLVPDEGLAEGETPQPSTPAVTPVDTPSPGPAPATAEVRPTQTAAPSSAITPQGPGPGPATDAAPGPGPATEAAPGPGPGPATDAPSEPGLQATSPVEPAGPGPTRAPNPPDAGGHG